MCCRFHLKIKLTLSVTIAVSCLKNCLCYLLQFLYFFCNPISFIYSDNIAHAAAVNIGQHIVRRISNLVSNWHNYDYEGNRFLIDDGGGDMYDTGNQVIAMVITNQAIRIMRLSFKG